MRPYAVQMALATNCLGVRKGIEGVITVRNMIVAQNKASEALRGLGQWRGRDGRLSARPKGKVRLWDGVVALRFCLLTSPFQLCCLLAADNFRLAKKRWLVAMCKM